MLRCITWLSPGLPLELFEFVVAEVGERVGEETALASCTESSGPSSADDPFSVDDADIGFMCAPSFRQLCSVTAVAAPVFGDPRADHEPVYFSDLVVREGIEAATFADLAGCMVGYNDLASLSGYGALQERLAQLPIDVELVHTGGHRSSLELLTTGAIDAAPIDSNTLFGLGGLPAHLRVLETWGPYPVQPVVVRRTMPGDQQDAVADALVSMADPSTSTAARRLREFGVERFAAVTDAHYDVVN